jgi:transposase
MNCALPRARELLADKGYDADWFREALANRKAPIPHDAVLYKQRHRIENRQTQGLETRPHPIRPLRTRLLLGNLHRRRCHLLAVINES